MSATTHRAEELANEYGFDFSVDEALDNEYYNRLESEGTLDREHMGWMEFISTVKSLEHNSQYLGYGYGTHIASNVCVRIHNAGGLENTQGYETLVLRALHGAGFYLTRGYGHQRM
jgi:hypothetical protein